MKKSRCFLCIAVFLLLSGGILAQEETLDSSSPDSKGFYVQIHTGYSYKMSPNNLAEEFEMYNISLVSEKQRYEAMYISLGEGFSSGGALGYMFNKYLGAEAALSYHWGKINEALQTTDLRNCKYTLSSKMLRVIPSMVLQAEIGKINPYAKVGCVFGTGKAIYAYENNYSGSISSGETKYSGGMTFGIYASAGLIFKLNKNLCIFGDINTINMSYSPTKGELTKAIENGVDILPDLSVYNKEVEFVDSFDREPYDPENPEPDYTQPRQELKMKLPYGSIGINAGLRINF